MQLNKLAATLAVGLVAPATALATNGMIMEGYGPIATGMGGASMAYDNGTAAMANNPATLGLMANGSRVDVMLGFVGPDLTVPQSPMGPLGASEADAFYMPAIGYVKKQDKLAYGVGIYGQGGMGTEYANGDMAQVSVGRVIFPAAYAVNERFNIGGSVDVVWGGMDLVANLDMIPATKEIDFKDSSDFTGKAKGYSLAAKLGFTYKLSDALTVGGVYQTASNLPDLKDGAWKVEGFDMPPVVGLGFAWQATEQLMLAVDVKDVMWGSSMNTVTIRNLETGLVVPFQQDWDDQTVLSLGLSYKLSKALTGRVGYNHGANPIPDELVNYLWPAIMEDHYTAGFGYAFTPKSELNFALSVAPEVTVVGTGPQNTGFTIEHSQVNWQLMYSHKF
ncbi:MAG: outer membrane protein transport protein [Thiobacillus sp.]|jgi:long-chain fatty acid transport protein|uniref:OmpP1/FadL family transporter n=1 Tax=Thiobacillus sp. TaxID=924 RepID=UPI0028959F63|nr:outer membrane protein transport protein [Thiobacillus sp.]MDT3706039.1 outer membrane protein transport protein [Thiobacillus sp.]